MPCSQVMRAVLLQTEGSKYQLPSDRGDLKGQVKPPTAGIKDYAIRFNREVHPSESCIHSKTHRFLHCRPMQLCFSL